MALFKRIFFTLIVGAILPTLSWAAPDSTLSVTPAAVSSTTITAADENDRNGDIVTWANAHDHIDISQTANTLNLGDGTAGDKTLTGNAADSPDRSIKWDDTDDQWEAQQNSTTYQALVVTSGTIALNNHGLVVGEGDLSIDTIGAGTSGQILISGGAGADPSFGDGGGTPNLTFDTTPSAGTDTTYIRTDDQIGLFDATVPEGLGTAAAGSAGTAARRDHVHPQSGVYQVLTDDTSSVADEDIFTVGAGKIWFLVAVKINHEAASNTDATYYLKMSDDTTVSLGTLASAGDILYATDGGYIILDSAGAFDTTATLTNFDGNSLKALRVERAGGTGTADYDIEMLVQEF